jgi:hypothetical protein
MAMLMEFHCQQMDPEPRDRQSAQDVLVLEQPCGGNNEQQERLPATEQPRACALTPPARGPTCDNNQRANEDANVEANANADVDVPPLFRGRCRTSPWQPCCCAAIRRRRPLWSDGCASS